VSGHEDALSSMSVLLDDLVATNPTATDDDLTDRAMAAASPQQMRAVLVRHMEQFFVCTVPWCKDAHHREGVSTGEYAHHGAPTVLEFSNDGGADWALHQFVDGIAAEQVEVLLETRSMSFLNEKDLRDFAAALLRTADELARLNEVERR